MYGDKMFTGFTTVIISQCIQILNHYAVYLKYNVCILYLKKHIAGIGAVEDTNICSFIEKYRTHERRLLA